MSSYLSQNYAYGPGSQLSIAGDVNNLALATSGGREKNPVFFRGRLRNPKQIADTLLTLSSISRTRFYSPAMIRERAIACADPVVTCDGDRLRFEVFSVCSGVYARFDIESCGLDGDWLSKGTTNVDFNPPMRAALSAVKNRDDCKIDVGTGEFGFERNGERAIERKVKLPVRWLNSFVEVQAHQTTVKPNFEMPALELQKILLKLPLQNLMSPGVVTYLTPLGSGFRLSQNPGSGPSHSAGIGAINRLKALETLLPHASSLKIYTSDNNVSVLEIALSEGRFILALSPNAARGFSGEGQVLSDLLKSQPQHAIASIRASLAWQSNLNIDTIAHQLRLPQADVRKALNILGTRGLVGFDVGNQAYFHREMPFDLALVEDLHPRIEKARRLLAEGAVAKVASESRDTLMANVKGASASYLVQVSDDFFRCTCPWFVKHDMSRGPCSHILALELSERQ
jgi:hypothetical protein